jgi:hypothetical protein
MWEHAGYSIVSYPCPQPPLGESALISRFRCALVAEEMRVLREAVEWCRQFLASRTSGDQPLTHLPAVAQAQASLVRDLHLLRHVDLADCLATPGGRRLVCEQVESACERLIKLVGGRAMLRGHMVFVTTLFTTLNRLYLEEAV